MKWADVTDGVWTIATAEREKSNAGSLALPAQALAIIEAQPRLGDNPYVFAGRGLRPLQFSQSKAPFDAKLPKMPRWTLHDLRRTARSLMSRAGVRPDISEAVFGHAIPGVEGIYDRHRYDAEKAAALERLATLIDGIVNPRENVTSMMVKRPRSDDDANPAENHDLGQGLDESRCRLGGAELDSANQDQINPQATIEWLVEVGAKWLRNGERLDRMKVIEAAEAGDFIAHESLMKALDDMLDATQCRPPRCGLMPLAPGGGPHHTASGAAMSQKIYSARCWLSTLVFSLTTPLNCD